MLYSVYSCICVHTVSIKVCNCNCKGNTFNITGCCDQQHNCFTFSLSTHLHCRVRFLGSSAGRLYSWYSGSKTTWERLSGAAPHVCGPPLSEGWSRCSSGSQSAGVCTPVCAHWLFIIIFCHFGHHSLHPRSPSPVPVSWLPPHWHHRGLHYTWRRWPHLAEAIL